MREARVRSSAGNLQPSGATAKLGQRRTLAVVFRKPRGDHVRTPVSASPRQVLWDCSILVQIAYLLFTNIVNIFKMAAERVADRSVRARTEQRCLFHQRSRPCWTWTDEIENRRSGVTLSGPAQDQAVVPFRA